ncbi:MAG: hypothetical protein WED09_10760 [Homoserinimonas sp.]
MSDFIQYSQWKQREESLPRELEQSRVIAERMAEDAAAPAARRKGRFAPDLVVAFRAFGRAADQR